MGLSSKAHEIELSYTQDVRKGPNQQARESPSPFFKLSDIQCVIVLFPQTLSSSPLHPVRVRGLELGACNV